MISLNITTFIFIKIIKIFDADNVILRNNNVIEIEMLETFDFDEMFKFNKMFELNKTFEIVDNIIIVINITMINIIIILLKIRLI